MKILVAGGAGFIGSHLCTRLVDEGNHVLAVDNLVTGSLNNLSGLRSESRFQLLEQDVEMYDDSYDSDLILHFASPASPVDFDRVPLGIIRANVHGLWRLLEVAERRAIPLLFASTSEVYGNPLVHPQPEDYFGNVDPRGPRASYDESKRLGEALVSTFHRQGRAAGAIVRIFNTYGPGMRPDDGRVVPEFFAAAMTNRPLILHGGGAQTRSFCYIDDLVDGVVQIAMDDTAAGEVFNLGNPNEISIAGLAHAIKAIVESSSPVIDGLARPQDPERRRPDISKVRLRYGWEPTTTLEHGLGKTFAWIQGLTTPG